MLAEVDRVSREERRSHSALVREALNRYFHDRFPTVSATRAELRAIARGRAQIAKGEFVTLEKILYDVDASSRKSRRKGTAKAPVS
jgi:predicted transcriptional regulator